MATHHGEPHGATSASTSAGILTIDLSAVQANWRSIKARVGAQVSAGAVIKADAYGLGAAQVGPALYRAGCRDFFVASLAEAREAQGYLPQDASLIVLGGAQPGDEAEFIARGLTPVLFSWSALERWRRACRAAGGPHSSALKVDTGMHRLGLAPAELDRLLLEPAYLHECGVRLVMSHLACADEPEHPLNREQLHRFQTAADRLLVHLPNVVLSLANSSGVFLGPQWHYDLVRTGAFMYGFNPQPGRVDVWAPDLVHPVLQLDLPVLQVREIGHGGTVGYGASAPVEPQARLAVVAGGYADGINRLLGRQAIGIVGEHSARVVGRISMDLTIFDISQLPADEAPAWIQVLNRELTVNHLSQNAGALGYEVLTSLGGRYQRRYLGGESDCSAA